MTVGPPIMKIRQVALASSNLEETDKTLRRLLGCDQSYADPEIIYFGLDNRLYTLGNCFLEVVSPVQPNTAAGRFLDRRAPEKVYHHEPLLDVRANWELQEIFILK